MSISLFTSGNQRPWLCVQSATWIENDYNILHFYWIGLLFLKFKSTLVSNVTVNNLYNNIPKHWSDSDESRCACKIWHVYEQLKISRILSSFANTYIKDPPILSTYVRTTIKRLICEANDKLVSFFFKPLASFNVLISHISIITSSCFEDCNFF